MKFKTTQKAIKENYRNIIKIGYCELQYLLYYRNADAFTCGVYGWNADFYEVNANTVISTGYRPIGNIEVKRELIEEYEKMAEFYVLKHRGEFEILKNKLDLLLEEFIKKAIAEGSN